MIATLLACVVPFASLQTTEAPSIAKRFRPGEEGTWSIEAAGARIGEHATRYVGREELTGAATAGAHHFRGWLRLAVPQLGDAGLRSIGDLWTDDAGHPLRFVVQALVGEAYASVELAFADGKAKAHIVQGPSARDVAVSVDRAALLLANNFVSHLEIFLALHEPGRDAKVPLFSPDALQGFPYELISKGRFEREVDGAKRAGEEYTDSLGERVLVLDGRLLEIEIASQQLVIRRTHEKLEPFTITAPEAKKTDAAFDGEDVRIARGEAFLAGRVTKPKGAKGKLPAAFFVSGSGAQDRNGISSGIDLGTHEILDRLTSEGCLVLRVDDRGAGESSPPPESMSYLDLVADSRACVAFLAKREDVDPKRIALIGHSEGGETVPILAAEDPSIAAIVLMAAPGRPLLEILTDQNRLALEESGLEGAELEAKLAEAVELLRRVCSDAAIDPASLPADQQGLLASRAWLQSHARQDPIATIRRVQCPVLILQGAKDFQVSLERDARALEKALVDAKHRDHALRAFPALDHLFKRAPGEKSVIADYTKNRPIDAEFLDELCAWLRPRLKLEKR